jgi:hypothetical protein
MKPLSVAVLALCLLVSCSGPVYVAKTQQEGIRSSYQDPQLYELSTKNHDTLREIYDRYQRTGVDVYPGGIGFTTLSTDEGKKLHFLLVDVRPRNLSFGEGQTKSQERFSEVYTRHVEKNLRIVKSEDLQRTGVDGLAFAVHWPVRDFSQCDSYGGFLEYVMLYVPKDDFLAYSRGDESFSEAVDRGEVLASLDRKPPKAIKVLQEE